MKLWNTSTEINKQIERFTIGDDPVYDRSEEPHV